MGEVACSSAAHQHGGWGRTIAPGVDGSVSSALEDALPGSEGQEQVNTQKVFPRCGQAAWLGLGLLVDLFQWQE